MHSARDVAGPSSLAWLLSLPLLAASEPLRAPERAGHDGGGGGCRARILLVEDDAAIAQMFQTQLSADGYSVLVAGDADQALEAMKSTLPELVLLDILLPGADGFWVLERIRERWAVPVVILSNYGDSGLIARGRDLGARDYVVKSRVTPGDLSRAIPGWMDRPDR